MKNKKRYVLIIGIAASILLSAVIWFAIKSGHNATPNATPNAAPNGRTENMYIDTILDDENVISNDSTVFEPLSE